MSNSLNPLQTTTPRKRKQTNNDYSGFLTPIVPAKRPTSLTMYFPKVTPSDGLNVMSVQNSKTTQTECSFSAYTSSHLDYEQQQLLAEIDELRRGKADHQRQLESTVNSIQRCLKMTRSLLIEKSQLEKKQARQKAMENRLRLGQFVTQRQGTNYVEQWVDGYDFLDKQRAQEQLARAKDILDRERKILTKKKIALQQQQQAILSSNLEDSSSYQNHYQNHDSTNMFNSINSKSRRTNKSNTIAKALIK